MTMQNPYSFGYSPPKPSKIPRWFIGAKPQDEQVAEDGTRWYVISVENFGRTIKWSRKRFGAQHAITEINSYRPDYPQDESEVPTHPFLRLGS